MSKLILDFELEKLKKAWRDISGHRKLTEINRLKALQTIDMLHSTIDELTENLDEQSHCHNKLYAKYLKFVSDDFDRVMENVNKSPTDPYKFDHLLGWCNKPDRIEKFIIHLLAQYDGKGNKKESKSSDPFSDEWWSKHFDKVTYFGDDSYRLLLVDQFGRYYVGPGEESQLLIIEHGGEMAINYKVFIKKPRPKAHGVNVTYILRRLSIKDGLREHQLRFVRKFAKGDLKNNILSRENNELSKPSNRRVLKVRRKGNNN